MSENDLSGRLLAELDSAAPAQLAHALEEHVTAHLRACEVDLALVDYDGAQLRSVRVDAASPRAGDPADGDGEVVVPVDGSDPGRAFATQQAVHVPDGSGGTMIYVPLTLRAEQLGVLGVRFAETPPAEVIDALWRVTRTVAYVLLAADRFTDRFERARRARPLTLPAEMQWNLLPVHAYSCPDFDVAGQLEPAYEVGGDCFDYSVGAHHLDLSITDAMGHALHASLLAAVAVYAIRNARRSGHGLLEQVHRADEVVHSQFGGDQFVTMLAMRADLRTGEVSAINAGHPLPWLVRAGRVEEVQLPAQPPLGLFPDTRYTAQTFRLQPGDRLILVSDGVAEARPDGTEEFGEARLEGALLASTGVPTHEVVRKILRAVTAFQAGPLRDDATVVCLDWRRP